MTFLSWLAVWLCVSSVLAWFVWEDTLKKLILIRRLGELQDAAFMIRRQIWWHLRECGTFVSVAAAVLLSSFPTSGSARGPGERGLLGSFAMAGASMLVQEPFYTSLCFLAVFFAGANWESS